MCFKNADMNLAQVKQNFHLYKGKKCYLDTQIAMLLVIVWNNVLKIQFIFRLGDKSIIKKNI